MVVWWNKNVGVRRGNSLDSFENCWKNKLFWEEHFLSRAIVWLTCCCKLEIKWPALSVGPSVLETGWVEEEGRALDGRCLVGLVIGTLILFFCCGAAGLVRLVRVELCLVTREEVEETDICGVLDRGRGASSRFVRRGRFMRTGQQVAGVLSSSCERIVEF